MGFGFKFLSAKLKFILCVQVAQVVQIVQVVQVVQSCKGLVQVVES